MAGPTNPEGTRTTVPIQPGDEELTQEALSAAKDPGGAHRKGYTADPGPEAEIKDEGPVPLASDAEVQAHVQKPDQSEAVKPAAPRDYTPNDRLMGADR